MQNEQSRVLGATGSIGASTIDLLEARTADAIASKP